jgi:hypothetical protein
MGEIRNAYKILTGISEGKRLPVICLWDYNIKMKVTEEMCEIVDSRFSRR